MMQEIKLITTIKRIKMLMSMNYFQKIKNYKKC